MGAVVSLLFTLTHAFPDIAARACDSDEEFLFIEAAFALLRWLDPKSTPTSSKSMPARSPPPCTPPSVAFPLARPGVLEREPWQGVRRDTTTTTKTFSSSSDFVEREPWLDPPVRWARQSSSATLVRQSAATSWYGNVGEAKPRGEDDLTIGMVEIPMLTNCST